MVIFWETLISTGIATLIVGFLARYLIDNRLQTRKYQHENELLQLKEKYSTEYELIKLRQSRFSESQFKLYEKLWRSLMDLKIMGEKLWEVVDRDNIDKFAAQLETTQENIDKASILIEEEHFLELNGLLTQLTNYKFGKLALFKLRRKEQSFPKITTTMQQGLQVFINQIIKKSYEEILSKLRISFRSQLLGS